MSEEYELVDYVYYLLVNFEVWFEWFVEKWMEYIWKFNEFIGKDVVKKKVILLDKYYGKEDIE